MFILLSGAVLGVLSSVVFIAAIVLFFKAGVIPALSFMIIAFLISPYGLPYAAAWMTGKLGGIGYALRDFVLS